MNEKRSIIEENIQHLIQSAFDIGKRPNFHLKKRTFYKLQKQLKKKTLSSDFSSAGLGVLCCLILFQMILFALSSLSGTVESTNDIPLLVMGGMTILNLASIPIAAYVIIKRRRYA